MRTNRLFKASSILSASLWLLIFALTPILLMLVISFLSHDQAHLVIWHLTLANYKQLFNSIFFKILMHSIFLALFCTVIILLLAYPAAFIIARADKRLKSILLMLMIIPFWTSSLIRTYAILALLKAKGLINSALIALGLIHQPLQILYTDTAVVIGIVYNLLPFMILPLYSNIEKLDKTLIDAARDLGASRMKILFDIIIPLTKPGIISGVLFVFLPAMTLFYIPNLLGGAKSLLLGNLIENQFLSMNDWPGGSATSIILTLIMILLIWFYRKSIKNKDAGGIV